MDQVCGFMVSWDVLQEEGEDHFSSDPRWEGKGCRGRSMETSGIRNGMALRLRI